MRDARRRMAAGLCAGMTMLSAGLAAGPARADCAAMTVGAAGLAVEDFVLVSRTAGRVTASLDLPVLGAGARCLAARAFPDLGLLFMEWHEGEAGTSVIVDRASLLAIAAAGGELRLLQSWLLRSGRQDRAGAVRESARSYRLVPGPDGIRVELAGPEVGFIEGQ